MELRRKGKQPPSPYQPADGSLSGSDKPNFYVSNRLYWNAAGITRIRCHRWPVEVYHQQGKEEGLDQYQLRNFRAIQRHVALVAVVYSMLRTAQHDPALQEKLQRQLRVTLEQGTADLRRAFQAHALWVLAWLRDSPYKRSWPLSFRPCAILECSSAWLGGCSRT